MTQLLPDQSQIDSHPALTADEEDAEEERGPRTGRKRLVNSKFKPSMRGKGGNRQNSDHAEATIVAPKATPHPPPMRQEPAGTGGGYTPHTTHSPTQPQANYLLATGRSEAAIQPRSDIKVKVYVHLHHHPGPAQRPASNTEASCCQKNTPNYFNLADTMLF